MTNVNAMMDGGVHFARILVAQGKELTVVATVNVTVQPIHAFAAMAGQEMVVKCLIAQVTQIVTAKVTL